MDPQTDENQNPVTLGPFNRNSTSTNASQQHPSQTKARSNHIHGNFDQLDDNELCVLATMALNTIRQRGIPHVFPLLQQPKQPDMFDNAKIEHIICAGLKPPYDGSPEKLLSTLNLIQIRRTNEIWYPATFMDQDHEKVDIVQHFSKLNEATVKERAVALWNDPDASTQCHQRGTPMYYACLLGVFLMNSITNEFALLLHSRIDHAYSSDGPLLLYTMCSHIHRNHLAFVESIKNKIRSSSLASFNNDVQSFLNYLTDNLKIITSTGASEKAHNDLIPHIFLQLRATTIPIFQQSILQWQREYFENKLDITPLSLVRKADTECQVLKHAHQWVETIDPSITAMQAFLQSSKDSSAQVFKTIAANFSEITRRQQDINSDFKHYQRNQYTNSNNNPEWIYDRPDDPNEIRHYHGRAWKFCTKCGRNGRWVCTHTDATHRSPDGRRMNHYGPQSPTLSHRSRSPDAEQYRYDRSTRYHSNRDTFESNALQGRWKHRSRSRSPSYSRSGSPSNSTRNVSFRPPTPKQPHAQLSLIESINNFLDSSNILSDSA
jgi:hypothetical protein